MLTSIYQWMEDTQTDLIYLEHPETIAYLTGIHCQPHERFFALFIPKQGTPVLALPALDLGEAKQQNWTGILVPYQDHENPWDEIHQHLLIKKQAPIQIAIEKNLLSVASYDHIQQHFHIKTTQDITPFIEHIKVIKHPEEIKWMKEAGQWADLAIEIGCATLKEGISEQEVVAEIEYQLKKRGVKSMSFSTMVLFGDHAANPHGKPGSRTLKKGELVLFDLGVIWHGYCSDITRTVAFYPPSEHQQQIYHIVQKAQQAAQDAVRPGIKACELDKIARDIITEAGYGAYFTHRLGHGIGTSVHEYPSINATNELILKPGMCFSIEPGIYIPDDVGVRIEDCVIVTETGCTPFTTTSKQLHTYTNDTTTI